MTIEKTTELQTTHASFRAVTSNASLCFIEIETAFQARILGGNSKEEMLAVCEELSNTIDVLTEARNALRQAMTHAKEEQS